MTDYSRFIAYIYEYVNGIKQYNAGFTKVEVRNGICKLQLMIKNTGRESKVKVYGLVREDGWLLGILLGEGQTQRQRLDLRMMTDSEKIGGTDYPFRKITGLFIQGAEGRTYATAWDEEPIFLDKFVTELPEKEMEVQASEIEETEVFEEIPRYEEPEASGEAQRYEEPEVSGEAQRYEEPEMSGEAQRYEEIKESERKEGGKERQTWENEKVCEKSEAVERIEEEKKKIILEKNSEQCECNIIEEKNEIKSEKPKEEMEKKSERWETIVHSFSRTDPFSDEEILECVQISPKDLMMVCQEEWRLGRNSFLLHGYYNYRHLILGRTKDDRWILGVPGVYERQEHFVASRFGFAGFKPAKSNKAEERPFGYWCRVLK